MAFRALIGKVRENSPAADVLQETKDAAIRKFQPKPPAIAQAIPPPTDQIRDRSG